jgi:hypothetical protein
LVERRHIIEDLTDSEADSSSIQEQPSGGVSKLKSKKRSTASGNELVPDDYYIEPEPAFILNVRPKTYGKRLASSSAQTDQKLQANGYLTTSAKSQKRRGVNLLSAAKRRRNKTQMQIPLHEPTSTERQSSQQQSRLRPKSADLGVSSAADSSLESQHAEDHSDHLLKSSLDESILGPDDEEANRKWRTCTIQTDSDSVTVQYVTISSLADAGVAAAAATTEAATGKTTSATGQDDGYVSGSGELKKGAATDQTGTKTGHKTGLFLPFCATSGADEENDLDGKTDTGADSSWPEDKSQTTEGKRDRKRKKLTTKDKETKKTVDSGDTSAPAKPEVALEQTKTKQPVAVGEATANDSSIVGGQDQATIGAQQSGGEEADESLLTTTTSRSISPTSKEQKRQLKLEKQERLKREKLEKQKQKELEESNAKAAKAQKKAEKEAKKKAEKAERLAKNASSTSSKAEPNESRTQSPEPVEVSNKDEPKSSETTGGVFGVITKTIQSVKFAPSPSKDSIGGKSLQKDGSMEASSLVDSSAATTNATSNDQEDNSLVHISIGTDSALLADQPKSEQETESSAQQLVSSSETDAAPQIGFKLPSAPEQTKVLKPILKQQSSSFDEPQQQQLDAASAQTKVVESKTLSSIADELVSVATEEAVQASAGVLEQAHQLSSGTSSPTLTSSASESKKEAAKRLKDEKAKLKAQLKAGLDEEKRLTKEAKRMAKQAEEAAKVAEREAKKAAIEAKQEAERQAEIAKREAEEALKTVAQYQESPTTKTSEISEQVDKAELKKRAKRSEAEAKRAAKEAEAAAKKQAKEAKAEAERLAKEEKARLKAEKKKAKSAGAEPSAPSFDLVSSSSPENSRSSQPKEQESAASADDNSKSVSIGLPRVSFELNRSEPKPDSGPGPAAIVGEQEASAAKDDAGGPQVIDKSETSEQPKKTKKAEKAKKTKKRKVEKGTDETSSISSSESSKDETSATEVVSKSSFLGRLFRFKSKQKQSDGELPAVAAAPKQDEAVKAQEDQPKQQEEEGQQQQQQQLIVSEMYPSDPDNADGEMILEVNLPEDMISETKRSQHTGSPDHRSPDDKATSVVTSVVTSTTDQQVAEPTDDQEATLVNLSQMRDDVNDDDDDEATENVLSQTTDFAADTVRVATDSRPYEDSAGPMQDQRLQEDAERPNEPAYTGAMSVESELEAQRTPTAVVKEVTKERSSAQEEQTEMVPAASDAPQAGTTSSPKEIAQDEKARKELEAKLEKEAKKRAKEEEKLRKKQEKEEKKRAELEAKKQAKEEKERLKREAKEAKKQAEREKKEAKKAKGKDKGQEASTVSKVDSGAPQQPPNAESAATADGEQQPPTTITTTTITSKQTISGDDSTLNPKIGEEAEQGRVLMSSTSEVPINEETEVERIVEEVVGEDGTVTKTTKTIETKYVTMRQEEVRVAERRDIPIDEWERIQAERAEQNARPSTSDGQFIERVKRQASQEVAYVSPELEEIRATPSYFDPNRTLPEIKPDTSEKKAFKKRIKLNQKLIKRALKLAKSESKRAQRDQRKAEAEIAVCDEAARQARKELKRAVKEAKRAAKLTEKHHQKMDKIDKKLAKNAKKLDKRQKKIDKRLAKMAKKQAKKDEKAAKKAAKLRRASSSSSSRSPSRGSKRSIKAEDIGEPVLLSSSRLSIVQNNPNVELSPRQQQFADVVADAQRAAASSQAAAAETFGQVELAPESSAENQQCQQYELNQEEISRSVRDGEHDVVYTITSRTTIQHGDDGTPVECKEETRILTGPEAEAAAMRMELAASREEDDEMIIDVVGEDEPAAAGADDNDQVESSQLDGSSPETNPAEQDKENTGNGSQSPGTPGKKKNKKRNKRQKSKEAAAE